MKVLLALLDSQKADIIMTVLHALSKILCSEKMKTSWSHFLELILLKIIDCYRAHKDVRICKQKQAVPFISMKYFLIFRSKVTVKIDEILKKIAAVLPVDGTINILNPVIATGEFPTNLCAIKLLLELVSYQGDKITDLHLDSVMPNIAKVSVCGHGPIQHFNQQQKTLLSRRINRINNNCVLLVVVSISANG